MNRELKNNLLDTIRDIPDFPKEGIIFKDITPILANPILSSEICKSIFEHWKDKKIEGVVGLESRGFFFGAQIAMMLEVPFIPIRKAGKLPYKTLSHAYDLEYGSAVVEMHEDAITSGQRILIHDDLLATGGTADAASELITKAGGEVAGYSFIIELSFLNGMDRLQKFSKETQSLISY